MVNSRGWEHSPLAIQEDTNGQLHHKTASYLCQSGPQSTSCHGVRGCKQLGSPYKRIQMDTAITLGHVFPVNGFRISHYLLRFTHHLIGFAAGSIRVHCCCKYKWALPSCRGILSPSISFTFPITPRGSHIISCCSRQGMFGFTIQVDTIQVLRLRGAHQTIHD